MRSNEGVRGDNQAITVPDNIALYDDDYIYFRYTYNNSTYYAKILISDLNSGEGQSLTFSTTNPL